jgi:hypothetical protein
MSESTPFSWIAPNTTSIIGNAKAALAGALRVPSSKDLLSFPVRVAGTLDRAIVRTIPNFLVRRLGIEAWTAQARDGLGAYIEAGARGVAGGTAPAAASGWKALLGEAVQAGTFKSYTGMLSYLTSRWAFSCFAMALLLNRVAVFGSTRQHINLTWTKRFALRLIPVMLFVAQIHKLLQAIQCQSSPDFMSLRFGTNNTSDTTGRGLEWHSEDRFLHWASSSILLTSSDADSCAARGMSASNSGAAPEYGSYSLLWPTFVRLCLSHLLETISCSLQQTPVMTEVAMSLFEHSLAFAEVEIMVSQTLGAPATSTNMKRSSLPSNVTEVPLSGIVLGLADATTSMAGAHRLNRANVPVEVLLVAVLSSCNALTSNLIAIFGKQRSLRLINTGFWACCFIASFIWAFSNESFLLRAVDGEIDTSRAVSSLLHFPTVVICGFVPHMIVLTGIFCCLVIYSIALVLTAFSLTSNPNIPQATGIRARFAIAHDNLQAAIQVRGINFKLHEDFYTALLRMGFTALTAASEAVFLNEGRSVEMRQFTWLEEERLDEIEGSHLRPDTSRDSTFQIAEAYGMPPSLPWATSERSGWESGYAKERKLEKDKETGMEKIGENTIVYPHPGSGGVGAMQRTTRFYLLFIFIRGIFFLVVGYVAWGFGVCLDRIGITVRPTWLRRLIGKATHSGTESAQKTDKKELDFWLMDRTGKLVVPTRDDLDIVPEMRRRLLLEEEIDTESVLDERVYGWFKMGGWFGTKDESTDYRPHIDEDAEDTTSVFSMATSENTSGYENDTVDTEQAWESESEGQRTPTRRSPRLSSREASLEPDADTTLDPATLARLLNPQDKAAKDEARMLAAHLANPNRIITRSTYRHDLANERSRMLLAGRSPGRQAPKVSLFTNPNEANTNTNRPLTPAEEAEILESLILSRRMPKPATTPSAAADESNNNDFHAQGPSCVVCQASPRTIIAWPCRCLCVCEDCRVNLALNNFGNCITCRRQVGGFVRLWVP